MTVDEIDELVRKYLSTGITVVVILVAPGTGDDNTPPRDPEIVAIEPGAAPAGTSRATPDEDRDRAAEPDPSAAADATNPAGGERDSGPDRTGAAGTDPDREPAGEGGDTAGGDTDRSGDAPEGPGTGADDGPGTDDNAARSTGSTAAEAHGWGTPTREDDFTGGTDQWDVYEGPGHDGQGTRSASAASIDGGVLTITGDANGTTAGMAWNPGAKYGRWEGRVRAPAGDPSYHALLLLWPVAEDWPSGGELDFMETSDASRQTTELFLHYGADNSQVQGSVEIDATQWHNWAIEWTPESITAFVDGREWYRTTDQAVFPPGPMHLCIQLDWFPEGGDVQESSMMVDWVRYYPLDAATSDSGGTSDDGLADGAAADDREAGNPGDGEPPIRTFLRRMFTWG